MSEWTKEWPSEPGKYWFYGYRYGRVSVGREQKKVMCLVGVNKNGSGGLMYVAEGSFMYKNETECSLFTPAILPKPPEDNTDEKE